MLVLDGGFDPARKTARALTNFRIEELTNLPVFWSIGLSVYWPSPRPDRPTEDGPIRQFADSSIRKFFNPSDS
jgi:hypothetical protein